MGSFQSNKMEKKSDIRLSAPPDFLESHTKRRFLRFVSRNACFFLEAHVLSSRSKVGHNSRPTLQDAHACDAAVSHTR